MSKLLRRLRPYSLIALVALTAACAAKTYHYAVQVEYAFSQAVAVVDDAVFSACSEHVLPADRCNTDIKETMREVDVTVKASALALQAAGPDAPLPKSVPDLIAALNKVRAVLDSVDGAYSNPRVVRILSALTDAVAKTTNLLYIFTAVTGGA